MRKNVMEKNIHSRRNKYSNQEYINFDLFAGDESKVECETSKIVTCRKEHECYGSYFPDWKGKIHKIKVGDRARFDHALVEGKWCGYYLCIPCLNKWIKEMC